MRRDPRRKKERRRSAAHWSWLAVFPAKPGKKSWRRRKAEQAAKAARLQAAATQRLGGWWKAENVPSPVKLPWTKLGQKATYERGRKRYFKRVKKPATYLPPGWSK